MALIASDINTRTENIVQSDSKENAGGPLAAVIPWWNKENKENKENEGPTPKAGKRSPKQAVAKGNKSPVIQNAEENPNSPTAAEKKAAKDNAVTAQLTKTKMCAFFSRGRCASTNCRYAHCADELRVLPNLQKTKLCRAFLQGGCSDDNCPFAHGEQDLRVTEGIYKTQICNFYERGYCKKGDRCNHAHGSEDLRPCTPSTKSSTATRSDGFYMDMTEEKMQQDENVIQQQPQAVQINLKPKTRRNPLPLAELLLDDNIDNGLQVMPTPTKAGSFMQPSMSPLGVGQSPECHWTSSLAPPFGQLHSLSPAGLHPMSPAGLHPMSPVSLNPLSPTSVMYPASPPGLPMPTPSSPLDMYSMLPREPLEVLLAQSQANPQSGTPGMGLPGYDHAHLAAHSSMAAELMAVQQCRNEANQSLLNQQQSMPLDERLASLDACVRDLAADVRNLQAPPATSSRTSAAPVPTQLFKDTTNTPKDTDNTQAGQAKSFRI
jgi:hypothetical protein